MTPNTAPDYAWLATRSKALLTLKEIDTLNAMRGAYNSTLNADPHVIALIDTLLAP